MACRGVHEQNEDIAHQVMKPTCACAPDVHSWPFSDRIQALQHLQERITLGTCLQKLSCMCTC